MATPYFTPQTAGQTITEATPFTKLFLTLDATGAPIDVSSGFTLQSARAVSASLQNLFGNSVDLSAIGTFTFGATGVTWSLSSGDILILLQSFQTTQNNMAIALTNDSSVTRSLLVNCPLALVAPLGGQF